MSVTFSNENGFRETAVYNNNLSDSAKADISKYYKTANNSDLDYSYLKGAEAGKRNAIGLIDSYWGSATTWEGRDLFKYYDTATKSFISLPLVKKNCGLIPSVDAGNESTVPFQINRTITSSTLNARACALRYNLNADRCEYSIETTGGSNLYWTNWTKINDGPGIFFMICGSGGGGGGGYKGVLGSGGTGGSGGGSGAFALCFLDLHKLYDCGYGAYIKIGAPGAGGTNGGNGKDGWPTSILIDTVNNPRFSDDFDHTLFACGGGGHGVSSQKAAGGTPGVWTPTNNPISGDLALNNYFQVFRRVNGIQGTEEGSTAAGKSYSSSVAISLGRDFYPLLNQVVFQSNKVRGIGKPADTWNSGYNCHGGGGGASILGYTYTDTTDSKQKYGGYGFGGDGGSSDTSVFGGAQTPGRDGGSGVLMFLKLS